MENIDKTPATSDNVMEWFRELRELLEKSSAKFDREMEKSNAERKEVEARFNRELERSRAESDKRRAESDKRRAESDKRRAESDKRRAELDKQQAETGRQIKELKETVNGMSKSDGLFAEEYFFNSFENGKRAFFGERFDDMERNVKGIEPGFKDEYDILLINGKSVGIIEVKYRGRLDDIPRIINKANTFRVNYPKYKNHRIFLAMASMMFNQRLEDECKDNGIAIVKQVGDTVVINDEHLKAY